MVKPEHWWFLGSKASFTDKGGAAYVDMDSDSVIAMDRWDLGHRLPRQVTKLIAMAEDELERKLSKAFGCIGVGRDIRATPDGL